MKYLFYLLAAVMVLGVGCKKREDGTTEVMSPEEVAEKTQEVAVKTTEKAAEVTKQAEEATKKASEAVSAMTVKAEDVMADLNKSVEQVKQKVADFDKAELLGYAEQYKDVILQKKGEIEALTEKVKGLSMSEMIGDKGKAIKDQIAKYSSQLNGLKDRYAVYLDKLETLGVDLSAYGL